MSTIIRVGKVFFKYQFNLEILEKINDLIEKLDILTKLKPFLCEECGLVMSFSGHDYTGKDEYTTNHDTYYCHRCKRIKIITY